MPSFTYLGGEQGLGRLEAALLTPQATWDGAYLYPTLFDQAAAIFRSIVQGHPLVDGNKRTGLAAMALFLMLNGYVFWMPRDEAVALAVRVAEERLSTPEIAALLEPQSVSIDRLTAMPPSERTRYSEYFQTNPKDLRLMNSYLRAIHRAAGAQGRHRR